MLDESSNLPKQLDFFEELGMDQSTINELRAKDNIVSDTNEKVEISSNNKHEEPAKAKKQNNDGSYTEYNYSERADAEDLVDFVSDFKEVVAGSGEQKARDVILDQIKESSQKKKRFRISRLFVNPIIGIMCALSAPFLWLGILIVPENRLLFFILAVLCTVLGILGVRNGLYIIRKVKHIYDIVREREAQGIISGDSVKIVKSVRNLLTWIVVSLFLWTFTFSFAALLFNPVTLFCVSLIVSIITVVRIVCFIKDIINKYNI